MLSYYFGNVALEEPTIVEKYGQEAAVAFYFFYVLFYHLAKTPFVIAAVIVVLYTLRRRGKKEVRHAINIEKKAGAGARFASFLMDLILVSAVSAAVSFISLFFDPFYIIILPQILTVSIGAVYLTYFLGNGQTIGMKAVKIKLCGTDGTYPIGYKKGFLRWVGMTISNLVIGLGYLWILIDENKQGWHDKIAGTYVVYFTPTQIEFFQSSETAV